MGGAESSASVRVLFKYSASSLPLTSTPTRRCDRFALLHTGYHILPTSGRIPTMSHVAENTLNRLSKCHWSLTPMALR